MKRMVIVLSLFITTIIIITVAGNFSVQAGVEGLPFPVEERQSSKSSSIVQQTIDKLARGETFDSNDPPSSEIKVAACCRIDHEGRVQTG